jgi:hypothetical protein
MSAAGWNSPSHMPSPTSQSNGYIYPDPSADPYGTGLGVGAFGVGGAGAYYQSHVRRPASTEPGEGGGPYAPEGKTRLNEMWTGAQ